MENLEHASRRHRRRAWTRPFRRTRRAIESSLHLIDSSCRVIEAAQKFAAGRPIRATRQLERASGIVSQAAAQLDCAVRGLQKMTECAAQSPDVALDAPGKLIDATARWIQAAGQLAAVSERLDGTSAWLFDSVKSGAIPIPVEERTADAGRTATTFKLTPPPPFPPPHWFAYETIAAPCIPPRHLRSVRLTVAEGVRRIFRGRAPPLVPTCSL